MLANEGWNCRDCVKIKSCQQRDICNTGENVECRKCRKCWKVIARNLNHICCDLCQLFFHNKCMGLPNSQAQRDLK